MMAIISPQRKLNSRMVQCALHNSLSIAEQIAATVRCPCSLQRDKRILRKAAKIVRIPRVFLIIGICVRERQAKRC